MISPAATLQPQPVGSYHRLLLHAAWGLVLAVFLTVGWLAMKPWDPNGAVSMLSHAQPGIMAVEVLFLAAVMSALATVLAGRAFPDVGAFAVAVGIAGVALKGDTIAYLLIHHAGRGLVPSLIVEALFWCAVMAMALLSSAFTVRWCGIGQTSDLLDVSPRSPRIPEPLGRMAAANAPITGRLILEQDAGADRSAARTGLKHLAIAVFIALVLIRVLSTGAPNGAIRHGQACFAVAIGIFVGVRRAQKIFPVGSTLWPCLTVPLTCLLAMSWAWLMSLRTTVENLPAIPSSSYLRILPITYISVGVVAALLAIWPAVRGPESSDVN